MNWVEGSDTIVTCNPHFGHHFLEKMGILPSWEVGFAVLPSRNGASLDCHYETCPSR
jgi:hypothetical protein